MTKAGVALPSKWICVGALAGAHGVKGEVKVKSFTDDPAAIMGFDDLRIGEDGRPAGLTAFRPVKGAYAARMNGIATREEAQSTAGARLYVDRASLPAPEGEDDFYVSDLIGLTAVDPDGRALGKVRGLADHGAGDVLEILLDQPLKGFGKSLLVPFEKRLVPDIDIAAGRLSVDLARWIGEQDDGPEGRAL